MFWMTGQWFGNLGALELTSKVSCQIAVNPSNLFQLFFQVQKNFSFAFLFVSFVCLICKFSRVENVLLCTERGLDLKGIPLYALIQKFR